MQPVPRTAGGPAHRAAGRRRGKPEQRIARRRFYLKNGFQPTGIFIAGAGGDMEIMSRGGPVSPEDYLELQAHALGPILFRLSGIKVVS